MNAPTTARVRLQLKAGGNDCERCYVARIAGSEVLSTIAFSGFSGLAAFAPMRALPALEVGFHERHVEGFLADAPRKVRVRTSGSILHCEFEGLGGLLIDLDRRQAEADAAVPIDLLPDVLLGPGLLLPLAAEGVLALHASAVRHAGRTFLLCGVSGSGKSSFARLAEGLGAEAWVDDIAPCRVAPTPMLLPRFPQLKWPQPLRVDDVALPIAGIVFVERGAAPLGLHALPSSEARLRLIRHTVAARLFPPALAAWHLEAVTALARSVPMARLAWPQCDRAELSGQVAAGLSELGAW